ncbi:MAG: SIS domain-containing protein [Eubacteriales bacterium]|nr:SIS domain-containing protein [Eubacteriales bacterium]
MSAINEYLACVKDILTRVEKTQMQGMEQAAHMLLTATMNDQNIFAFGCGHAGLLAQEMYYRSGGMATINPVRAPGLALDVDPATMTSAMERLPEYGRIIVDFQPMVKDDIIIIHSVSGRNHVPVDVAMRCKEIGVKVIALTNLTYSKTVFSRHTSGLRLFEVADLVLDNCGHVGDGALQLAGLSECVGPTSTAIGAAMLNAMMCRAVELIAEQRQTVPVLVSGNVEGGDKYNQQVLNQYRKHIFYMG